MDPAFVSIPDSQFTQNLPAANSDALAGLRLAVKDLFDIAGLATAAGNPDWLKTHQTAANTHPSISTLLSKGATYVGKTLTDELAYSLNGQNIHYPTLLNPVTPNRLVGGSSSGSAAAVAAGLADIGLGTDTGGSIRVPASYNGLFGLRTTHGVIPCDHMVSLAPSFDTVGWLTVNLQTMKKTANALLLSHPDIEKSAVSIGSVRIIIAQNLIEMSSQSDQINHWVNKIQSMLSIGNVSEITLDTNALDTSETFRTLQGFEIWKQHGDWIENTQPRFAEDIASRMRWCSSITDSDYAKAIEQRRYVQEHINSVFDADNTFLLIPTTPGCSPLLDLDLNELAEYRNQLMALTAIAGLTERPQLHLPAFTIDSAPCGISLIGPKYSDLQLIDLAKRLLEAQQGTD